MLTGRDVFPTILFLQRKEAFHKVINSVLFALSSDFSFNPVLKRETFFKKMTKNSNETLKTDPDSLQGLLYMFCRSDLFTALHAIISNVFI